jgi:hypothetical protein
MKKTIYFFIAIALTTFGCGRHYIPPCCTANRAAVATAQKNGVLWSPIGVGGSIYQDTYFNLAAGNYLMNGAYTKIDSLNIETPTSDPGTYKLHSGDVFYATFANGTETDYKLDTTYNNVMNITSFQILDQSSGVEMREAEVKGTFNLKFIDPANPTGITFSNGSFYTIFLH